MCAPGLLFRLNGDDGTALGPTVLWATKRNETLTRYHFLRHSSNQRSQTQSKILEEGRWHSQLCAEQNQARQPSFLSGDANAAFKGLQALELGDSGSTRPGT